MSAPAHAPAVAPLSEEWVHRAYRRYLISIHDGATATAWWFTFDPISGEQRPTVMVTVASLSRTHAVVDEIAYDPRDGSEFIRALVHRTVARLTEQLKARVLHPSNNEGKP